MTTLLISFDGIISLVTHRFCVCVCVCVCVFEEKIY
jgi:hypothetical protein